jgi:anti-anti-sigma regulatory factor
MDCGAKKPQRQTLVLDGDCTLDRALELKSVLLEALKDHGDLLLNLDNATVVDLSLLQLLCAAHRAAMRCGKQLVLCPKPSNAFIEAAEGAGFLRTMGCQSALNKGCLFMEVMTNG